MKPGDILAIRSWVIRRHGITVHLRAPKKEELAVMVLGEIPEEDNVELARRASDVLGRLEISKTEEIENLRAALEPFAKAARWLKEHSPRMYDSDDSVGLWTCSGGDDPPSITLLDVKRALAEIDGLCSVCFDDGSDDCPVCGGSS